METFITIYTKWFLNWGQTENAMIFILTGVTASLRYLNHFMISERPVSSLLALKFLLLGPSSFADCPFLVLWIAQFYTWPSTFSRFDPVDRPLRHWDPLLDPYKLALSYIVVTILASKRILEDRQILLTGISSLLVTVIFIAVALSMSYFGQPTLPYVVCFSIFFFCAS